MMPGSIVLHGSAGSEIPQSVSTSSVQTSLVSSDGARPRVTRTTARPVSAMQRRQCAGDPKREGAWIGSSISRPTSAGVHRGRIRPHSALARAPGMQNATSSDDDLDDTYSIASTRRGKPSRASSPNTYTSGYISRPLSGLSRPVSAMSRTSDVETVHEDEEGPVPTVTRRYYTKDITTADGAKMSHFSVKIPVSSLDDKTSYLRIYYSDLLNAEPITAPVGPNERTIEVEKMAKWLSETVPRSRVDAYPLLVLTREILKRFVSNDLTIVSRDAKRVAASLELANKALKKTQHDLAKSINENALQTAKMKHVQELADMLPGLEAALQASEIRGHESDAKISQLHKKAEEQANQFKLKLEETKAAVKDKCDAANEKRMEALIIQVGDYQKKMDAYKEELKSVKTQLSQSEKNLQHEKACLLKQLEQEKERELSLSDVLKALETMGDEGKLQLFKHLMTAHDTGCALTQGSFLYRIHQTHSQGNPDLFRNAGQSNDDTPLLRLMLQHGLYSDGCFNLDAYSSLSEDASWDLLLAFMVEHLYDEGAGSSPKNGLDALLIPAMRMAVGHQPVMSLAGVDPCTPDLEVAADLVKAMHQIQDLSAAKELLGTRVKELEVELEALKSPPPPPLEDAVKIAEPAADEKKAASNPKDDDWCKMKRPKALAVFKMDPKMFKGKPPQPARVDQMLQMFANIYEGKAHADMVDDREGNTRQSFPEFMRDWMINKFGLKSIALSNLASLIMGIQAKKHDKDAGIRIRVFGLLSGIIPHACWHEDLSNIITMALGLLFQISKISENMGHSATKKPLIEAQLTIEATKQAWDVYGFGKVPLQLDDAMVQMARREGGQIRLHEWLELLCDTWLTAAETMDKDLREIFKKNDTNGDGVLDLGEFRTMIQSLLSDGVSEHEMDERQISRLFAEALEESSAMKSGDDDDEEDVMQPEAFVRVARRARLHSPSH